MKNTSLIAFIILLAGTFLSGYFGPWWAPAAFIVLTTLLLGLNKRQGIVLGAISMASVYLIMALWMRTGDQADILAKTGMLLGGMSTGLLIALTTAIGGVTGFLSGWLGSAIGVLVSGK